MLDVLYTVIIVIEVFLQPQFILVVIVQVGLVENAQHLVQAIVDLPLGLWFFSFFFQSVYKGSAYLSKNKINTMFFPSTLSIPCSSCCLCCLQLFVFLIVYQSDRLSVNTPGMIFCT